MTAQGIMQNVRILEYLKKEVRILTNRTSRDQSLYDAIRIVSGVTRGNL
jgi:hypothetical protein